jgi:ATP-dependent helicase HrpB
VQPLPIDAHLEEIAARLREHRAVVVVAPPGAGKTTRVPPRLATDGRVIVLQPRRIAARAIARRIADERGWSLGREVGWHVRLERHFTGETRVLLATEGILTARLQQDPLLGDFTTIVLDEFHERSIHADLGLALARQAWLARDDLRLLVMSATLDSGAVSRYLGGCPVIEVPGRTFPLTIEHTAEGALAVAVRDVARRTAGHVLCFLPGAPEIARAAPLVAAAVPDFEVCELHGSLDPDRQDEAIRPSERRRVVLATNIAETSLTVPGVSAVVDAGWQKVPRYDTGAGFDRLVTERITADAAAQRAGRAGRTGPGLVIRLWDERLRLRPHREPEIARIDLAGPVLELIAWGGRPDAFEWFEPPTPERLTAAVALLTRLRLMHDGRVTPLGERGRRLPLHPRLASVLAAGGGAPEAAAACALLAERPARAWGDLSTTCDLLPLIDRWHAQPEPVRAMADALRSLTRSWPREDRQDRLDEPGLRRALLAGYPDRVARRRAPASARLLLSSGAGATLTPQSGVRDGLFLLALDVTDSVAPPRLPAPSRHVVRSPAAAPVREGHEALVRLASIVDREWLEPTAITVEHALSEEGNVRATRIEWYERLPLSEVAVGTSDAERARLLSDAWLGRPHDEGTEALVNRLRFAGLDVDLPALARDAAQHAQSLGEIDLTRALPWTIRTQLELSAPERLTVPSGRSVPLEYRTDGTVAAAVKLQELFGLAETPRVGPRQEPVLFLLLAPNGRPVQTTADLRSFWERTYPEVRKELRGRYPRHPWPEDPWTAVPTRRVKPRG